MTRRILAALERWGARYSDALRVGRLANAAARTPRSSVEEWSP